MTDSPERPVDPITPPSPMAPTPKEKEISPLPTTSMVEEWMNDPQKRKTLFIGAGAVVVAIILLLIILL